MKNITIIQIIFLFIFISSCNIDKNENIKENDTDVLTEVSEISDKKSNGQFSIERLNNYCHKLDSIFNFRDSTQQYSLHLDTLVNGSFIKIKYYFQLPKNGGFYNTQFEVYQFESLDSALWFYKDLYTQEYIFDFGIDKRVQYIIRNDSTVIWHHFNSPYSHKFKDIKSQFIKTFNICYGEDSDSLININCCRHGKEIDRIPDEIKGKWYIRLIGHVSDTTQKYVKRYIGPDSSKLEKRKRVELLDNGTSVIIDDKTLNFNGLKTGTRLIKYNDFPSTTLFFKYLNGRSAIYRNENVELYEDLIDCEMELYRFGREHALIKLSNGGLLLINGAYLYSLKE